jgi:hypothetical protein
LKNSPPDPENRNEPDRTVVARQARCAMVDVNVTPFEIETKTRHGDIVRADVYLPKGASCLAWRFTLSDGASSGVVK